ncbi:hypothetical protein [Paenibacillus qinlingensis]|uniref:hypothetical protein n=1 Tax=Paenibacillus qinlingensis TaxID=1837343 RepID=UPI0015634FA4|nr:hypothetical protein [Paenibacillus qinlingensis]NQX63078.1 hypothetical protein [Paenibacillus qinlingensis]
MKKIWTDFNGPNLEKIRITDNDLKHFELSEGEKVILYTEDIQGEAVIEYDNVQGSWVGKFVSEVITVSKEIEEAREDGFVNGKHFGNWTTINNLARRMKELKLSAELIHEVTGLSYEKIRGITLK